MKAEAKTTSETAAPVADRKTKLPRKELLRFEKRLLEEKTQVLRQRGYTGSMLSQSELDSGAETNNNPYDSAEQGYDTYQREFASHMTSGQTKSIIEIDEALRRVERKTYGVCESCGKPIAKARLDMVPQTRYCMKCIREMEEKYKPVPERRRGRRR